MSIIRQTKKCPKCKKTYVFNPDVGEGLICPYCMGTGKVFKKPLLKKHNLKTKGRF